MFDGENEILFHNGEQMEFYCWIIEGRISVCKIKDVPALNFTGPTRMRDIEIYDEWSNKMKRITNLKNTSVKAFEEITDDFVRFFIKRERELKNNLKLNKREVKK